VSRWANHLGLASRVLCQRREHELTLEASVKDGLPPRPLNDIGFGLSQVLPVLVAGLSMEYGERLVAEQPEAHLHPRSQARLADFFCAMAKSDRHALVETHSEAFFHRLRYWQARDDELASRIVVYFLGEPSNQGLCGPPREIALSEEGEPSWPRGFLEDAFNAELEIRKLQAEKRERK
jgi:predicted ATPase